MVIISQVEHANDVTHKSFSEIDYILYYSIFLYQILQLFINSIHMQRSNCLRLLVDI